MPLGISGENTRPLDVPSSPIHTRRQNPPISFHIFTAPRPSCPPKPTATSAVPTEPSHLLPPEQLFSFPDCSMGERARASTPTHLGTRHFTYCSVWTSSHCREGRKVSFIHCSVCRARPTLSRGLVHRREPPSGLLLQGAQPWTVELY